MYAFAENLFSGGGGGSFPASFVGNVLNLYNGTSSCMKVFLSDKG